MSDYDRTFNGEAKIKLTQLAIKCAICGLGLRFSIQYLFISMKYFEKII